MSTGQSSPFFYLLSGFHRSGTSLVAQSLLANGVCMGDDLMGASFANPRGHVEDKPLVALHDDMLASCGVDWRVHHCASLTPMPEHEERLLEYVTSRLANAQWQGAKDPRAVHFFDPWHRALPGRLKTLLVFRDWRYSVSSLLKRHSRDLLAGPGEMASRPIDFDFWKFPELAARMWLSSSEAMLQWHEKDPDNTLLFALSAFRAQSAHLFDACERKGISPTLLSLSSNYEPSLLQTSIHPSMLDMLPAKVVAACDLMQQRLHAVCDGSSSAETIKQRLSQPLAARVKAQYVTQSNGDFCALPIVPCWQTVSLSGLQALIERDADATIDENSWVLLLQRAGLDDKGYEALFFTAMKAKRWVLAELCIQRSLAKQPASWRYLHLGDMYLHQGLLEDADKCYRAALARTPNNGTVVARQAEVKAIMGEPDEAQALIDTAERLDASKLALTRARQRLAMLQQHNAERGETILPAVYPVLDFDTVVAHMTQSLADGQALDSYMVKAAMVNRNLRTWLMHGCQHLSAKAALCLLDYLVEHAVKHWPPTILAPELLNLDDADLRGTFNTAERTLITGTVRVGVHIHAFYPSLLPQLLSFVGLIPCPTELVITCTEDAVSHVRTSTREWPNARIIPVPNRGRDLGPWLVTAAPMLAHCDIALKLHTKASPHASHLSGWRLQLLWALLGDTGSVTNTVNRFSNDPTLGLLMPTYHPAIVNAIHWGENALLGKDIADQLGLAYPEHVNAFPAGSMFWYRPNALRRLWEAFGSYEHFPEEQGQTDGTVMHAIERLLPTCVEQLGYTWGYVGPSSAIGSALPSVETKK